jgi:hypothetical protein
LVRQLQRAYSVLLALAARRLALSPRRISVGAGDEVWADQLAAALARPAAL